MYYEKPDLDFKLTATAKRALIILDQSKYPLTTKEFAQRFDPAPDRWIDGGHAIIHWSSLYLRRLYWHGIITKGYRTGTTHDRIWSISDYGESLLK